MIPAGFDLDADSAAGQELRLPPARVELRPNKWVRASSSRFLTTNILTAHLAACLTGILAATQAAIQPAILHAIHAAL